MAGPDNKDKLGYFGAGPNFCLQIIIMVMKCRAGLSTLFQVQNKA